MEFAQFILEHDGDDLGRLALARDRYAGQVEDFDLALNTLEARRKLRGKVPEFVALPQLRFPFKLSAEQCSSTETARYKASVALHAAPCAKLADLTGGLGVDSWAFAQVFTEVLYNEMRPELADAARYNFGQLCMENIHVRNCELRPGNLEQVLDGFRPDIVFLDPARRAEDGRKVFRLEDCQPDVLQLLPELFQACPRLLLKLSPMADITLVCKQLQHVKAVHVVAAEGECKELLLLLERDYDGPYSLTICENGAVMVIPDGGCSDVPKSSLRDPSHSAVPRGHKLWAPPSYAAEGGHGFGDITTPSCLFEPGKALLKAGAFDLPCEYGLEKLDRHTHLYVGAEVPEVLKPFGKVFRILETVPLNNRSIRDIGKRYPSAEVTARNLPLSSDELRKKLGVSSGGSVHIFGCTLRQDRILLVVQN